MQGKPSLSLSNWAVIPAAGVGSRMQSEIPKQYLPLAEKTILEHSLSVFINHPMIEGLVVSISDNDPYWPEIKQSLESISEKPILQASGGLQRSDSVLSALKVLFNYLQKDCWVFVHDSARPCLLASDIDKLIQMLQNNEVGGLLALPISDTLKLGNNLQQVEKTISRENMWRALTPQCFKLQTLINALQSAENQLITDEASAIELLGLKPELVAGDHNNIKVTHPADLVQAENFIKQKISVS